MTDKAADVEEVRVEDRDVPEAHRGLHDFLYSNNEDHGATAKDGSFEFFDGNSLYEVSGFLTEHRETKHAAVYAVIGEDRAVSYVGITRNVALSVACHLDNEGGNMVNRLKVRSFKFPKRADMEALRDKWVQECGSVPVGNMEGNEWASTVKEVQGSMTTAQKEQYEENKLKMRRAMADSKLIDEMEQLSSEEIERRRRLELAVTGDDWSGVIDAQTQGTVKSKLDDESTETAEMISPFSSDGMDIPAGVGPDGMASATAAEVPTASDCNNLEFNLENVDKVLDEVRPYLVADGGNVRVMGVDKESRVVKLALQGACGNCPSSTTTMKMGIERVLNENFADLGGVEQVDEASGNAMAEATTAVVEAILEPIRPAMAAMRAQVKVLNVLDGVVTLSYKGHRKVAYGIELALLDNPLIRGVEFQYED
ncbi:unnamed protein product [Discosporangium mesarthrocarpum]